MFSALAQQVAEQAEADAAAARSLQEEKEQVAYQKLVESKQKQLLVISRMKEKAELEINQLIHEDSYSSNIRLYIRAL
jgi:hypothetical protein